MSRVRAQSAPAARHITRPWRNVLITCCSGSTTKDALLVQLKKKKEQSTKMQRFFLTSVQQDILCRSPIDRDTLLKALKHKCKYVMLEVFAGKAQLGEYMQRMQRLEYMHVRLISSHPMSRSATHPPAAPAPLHRRGRDVAGPKERWGKERWGSKRWPEAVLGWGCLKHDPTQGWCGD